MSGTGTVNGCSPRPRRAIHLAALAAVAVCVSAVLSPGGRAVGADRPVLGDYDAELRRGEHVDVQRMVRRLTELGANTYMWLIWHSRHDWDDLHEFLPLAEKAGIDVWVYLVPHSETALQDPRWPYSEPFRVDYVRWAEEIARLSLVHENLVGYVIDDFWANVRPGRFTPDYTRQMVQAGKAINPRLKFYPLMYYRQFGLRFAEQLAPLVDGVVAAYPKNREEIEHALKFLNDRYTIPPHIAVIYPGNAPSKPGHRAFVTQEVAVTNTEHATLRFHYEDDYDGPTEGYHFMQLCVNDRVIWEEDVAGRDKADHTVDLSALVGHRRPITLSFGVLDKKGVSNYPVHVGFSNIEATGLRMSGNGWADSRAWKQQTSGRFAIRFDPGYAGSGRYHLPLIVMPAGSRSEYEQRNKEKATPQRIAAKVRMVLELVAEGKVQGVVTYCLDKREGNEDFAAVAHQYKAFTARRGARGVGNRPPR